MKKTSDVLNSFDKDSDFMRQIALEYIDLGNFRAIEARMGIELGTLEHIFFEFPRYEEKFDEELEKQASKKLQRESRHRIFKLLKSLDDLIELDKSDGKNAGEQLRAVQILAQILQKAINIGKVDKGAEDDMEKLWKDLERERKAKSNLEAMP
jgi:hypothetical protein